MAVPPFHELMLPILRITGDGREHTLPEVIELLADQLELSQEDRTAMLPGGSMTRFRNRVGWAKTYLRKAGLLALPSRGRFQITDRGREVLGKQLATIDVAFLEQYEEYKQFQARSQQAEGEGPTQEPLPAAETPEEVLEASYQALRNELAEDLLEQIKKSSPAFFERLVVDLLVAMGYGGSRRDAGEAVGRSGDGGIDGIIKEDKLGLDAVYIQAKRWEGVVGRPVVQAFAGSLEGHRARKGVLLTTSGFSKDALDYVTRIEKKIVLIDGHRLAQLMIDYDVGVAETARYVVKKIDQDYFEGEE